MDAIIGLAGVVIGSLITGFFWIWSNRLNNEHDQAKEKRRLLLEKYELIYSGLLAYQKLANDISLQMLSEAGYGGKFDASGISKDYASSNLKMNVTFYAPKLSDLVDEMNKKHKIIARLATGFILDNGQSGDSKEQSAGKATIAATELQNITQEAIEELARLASSQVNA